MMRANQSDGWKELSLTLERLERAATDGVVPGELRSWSEDLEGELASVVEALPGYARQQRALLARILEQDLALGGRVEDAQRGLEGLTRRLIDLWEETDALRRRDLEHPDSSDEPTAALGDLRHRVLEWIVDARALEGDVRTWLLESLERDRGVVD